MAPTFKSTLLLSVLGKSCCSRLGIKQLCGLVGGRESKQCTSKGDTNLSLLICEIVPLLTPPSRDYFEDRVQKSTYST